MSAVNRMTYRTQDHPYAAGKEPPKGERVVMYSVLFTLEGGVTLCVELGAQGWAELRRVLVADLLLSEGLPLPANIATVTEGGAEEG